MTVLDFTADRYLDDILACWADEMSTADTAKLINKRHGAWVTEAQVANTLAKYRDQLAIETEIHLSARF